MKKAAVKKTVVKNKKPEVSEVEELVLKVEPAVEEPAVEEPAVEEPAVEEPVVEEKKENVKNTPSEGQKKTFKKFLESYSPACIDESNAKLVYEGSGFLIKINCKVSGIQNSVPKFIDSLSVVFE